MKPEPSPLGGGTCPRGIGWPNRRKNSPNGSPGGKLGMPGTPATRCCLPTTATLTTAGPYCSTSDAKSGNAAALGAATAGPAAAAASMACALPGRSPEQAANATPEETAITAALSQVDTIGDTLIQVRELRVRRGEREEVFWITGN